MPEKKKRTYENVGRKTKRPPVEQLAALYENYTTKQLAAHYGVPENTVKGWIHYYRYKSPEAKAAAKEQEVSAYANS